MEYTGEAFAVILFIVVVVLGYRHYNLLDSNVTLDFRRIDAEHRAQRIEGELTRVLDAQGSHRYKIARYTPDEDALEAQMRKVDPGVYMEHDSRGFWVYSETDLDEAKRNRLIEMMGKPIRL